ncbi:MAG: acyltransferase [Fretibacterium sp.]|nr:acyltransferase [Fretibacterium sp.]
MKQRLLKYDVMRIAAIAMVLMGHISAYIVLNYPATDKMDFIVGNIFNGLRRGAAVPVFLMITGALLLDEDKRVEPRIFYKSRLLPLALLTVFWLSFYGVFYAFILPAVLGKAANAGDFADYILGFKGSKYPHLWYMFMTVGVYLSVPFLRLFVRRENRTYILGFILTAVVVQFIPNMLDFLTIGCYPTLNGFMKKFYMQSVTGFTGYLLLGWYLSVFPPSWLYRAGLYILGLFLAVASTIAVQRLIADIPGIRAYLYDVFSLHLFVAGAAVFVLISALCGDAVTEGALTKTLSGAAFGIYAVHVAFLEIFSRVLMPYDAFMTWLCGSAMRPLAYILLLFAAVWLCSLSSVLILSRVRGLKSLFRY